MLLYVRGYAVAYYYLLMIFEKFIRIQERLETRSVEDIFASLGRFNPRDPHQQFEVLRKDVLLK